MEAAAASWQLYRAIAQQQYPHCYSFFFYLSFSVFFSEQAKAFQASLFCCPPLDDKWSPIVSHSRFDDWNQVSWVRLYMCVYVCLPIVLGWRASIPLSSSLASPFFLSHLFLFRLFFPFFPHLLWTKFGITHCFGIIIIVFFIFF